MELLTSQSLLDQPQPLPKIVPAGWHHCVGLKTLHDETHSPPNTHALWTP